MSPRLRVLLLVDAVLALVLIVAWVTDRPPAPIDFAVPAMDTLSAIEVTRTGQPAVTLKRTGLWDWLDPHIYSARDLAHPKPAPDVYLHAAEQLRVAPQDCIVVEDSPSGARAARAAGMRCIGYQPEGHPQALNEYCDIVISDMAEAITLLGV